MTNGVENYEASYGNGVASKAKVNDRSPYAFMLE